MVVKCWLDYNLSYVTGLTSHHHLFITNKPSSMILITALQYITQECVLAQRQTRLQPTPCRTDHDAVRGTKPRHMIKTYLPSSRDQSLAYPDYIVHETFQSLSLNGFRILKTKKLQEASLTNVGHAKSLTLSVVVRRPPEEWETQVSSLTFPSRHSSD